MPNIVMLQCAYLPCSTMFLVLAHRHAKFCSPACYSAARNDPDRLQALFAERFWCKVAKGGTDDCWLWTGALHGKGYGNFRATPYKAGAVSAHIVSWFLHTGVWPADGLFVHHSCDNMHCARPDHLCLGTPIDNMQDCAQKGRNVM